jgi:predicted nucleic acid-binding protein
VFILDASVCLASLLDQPQAERGDLALSRISVEPVYVPAHWAIEVTNVLAREARRGVISADRAMALAREAAGWPLIVDDETHLNVFSAVMAVAMDLGLTTYDAAYLELSDRIGVPLATFDRELADAARRAGVRLVFEEP